MVSDNTKIEWADATVNAINGCSVTSPGCTHCYAMKQAHRFPARQGLTVQSKGGMVWTGETRLNETALLQPLKWKRHRRIFWNAHGDTFHDSVPDAWIDRVFAVAALTPQHTHMILTKRTQRMREYLSDPATVERIYDEVTFQAISRGDVILRIPDFDEPPGLSPSVSRVWLNIWPLPNVWLGVSVEDQTRADERIPNLLATPAAVRFLSCEPLLGPVDVNRWLHIMWRCSYCQQFFDGRHKQHCPGCGKEGGFCGSHPFNGRNRPPRPGFPFQSGSGIDWVIAGGESGPGARPMHPDWARSLRDQCAAAGVPFHFKQWGEWAPQVGAVDGWSIPDNPEISRYDHRDWEGDHWGVPYAKGWMDDVDDDTVSRIGKKRAGRLLDGIEHNGLPA